MRLATWHGGTRFTLDEAPDPAPGPGEVVVRVDTVGICGTDVHVTQGLFAATPPAILGHEFSGHVAAVGAGVDPGRDLHCREIVVRGAFGRGDAFARALHRLPGLGLEALITTRYPLDQVSAALAAATAGRGVKTALAPGRDPPLPRPEPPRSAHDRARRPAP